jgi:hypothetical protein
MYIKKYYLLSFLLLNKRLPAQNELSVMRHSFSVTPSQDLTFIRHLEVTDQCSQENGRVCRNGVGLAG